MMLGLFYDTLFKAHMPPYATPNNIIWWTHTLSHLDLSHTISSTYSICDISAFSDASSGARIGIIIGNWWDMWSLLPG